MNPVSLLSGKNLNILQQLHNRNLIWVRLGSILAFDVIFRSFFCLCSLKESKSYCSVESVLLDFRSGIMVKSIVSTESFTTEKSNSDTNFSETIKKAELEAVAKALGSIANEVVTFMNNVPRIKNL